MKKILQHPIFILVVALTLGILIGRNWTEKNSNEPHSHHAEQSATYTCSMHPSIQQDEPGDCPICGMDLVPMSKLSSDNDSAVFFDSHMTNQAQIEVVTVGSRELDGEDLVLNGEIRYNAGERRNQTAHFSGRLERVYFNSEGEYIRKGDKIAEMYSPELSEVHREILEIKKRYGIDSELMAASKERLINLKLPEEQIRAMIGAEMAWNTFAVYSDYTGYIEKVNANEGMHLNSGETFFFINEFSSVWAVFDVFEKDLTHLRPGHPIEISLINQKNQRFESRIDFISTQINPNTRTAEVRATLSNPEQKLKPNSLINGVLSTSPSKNQELLIPESAVLWTGKRSIVYVAESSKKGGYHFTLREVTTGKPNGGYYPVYSGLSKGEMIAVSGAFVIDATAELNDRPSMMSSTKNEKISLSETDSIQLTTWVKKYIELKDVLVESDYEKAMQIAREMKKLQVPEYEQSHELTRSLEKLYESSNLETFRKHFISFSEELIQLSMAIHWNKTLVVQYCPMADNNNGAKWLSQSTEIRNPYYGDAMLMCGEVVRKLK